MKRPGDNDDTDNKLGEPVDPSQQSFKMAFMEVNLNPESKSRLAEPLKVEAKGMTRKEYRLFTKTIKQGEASLKRGDFFTHEEVGAKLLRLFQS